MDGERYRRARLCRLCECPIVDGGVRLQKPHMEKLSKWYKSHLGTDLEETNCFACHFCMWDMRFADQHSEEKETRDQTWWTQEDRKKGYQNYYKYYSAEWMKPCSVKIAPLPKEYRQERSGHCLYCPQSYPDHESLVTHVKMVHPEEFVYCSNKRCGIFFRTEGEKQIHIIEIHENDRSSKCVYCGKVSIDYKYNSVHIANHHKNQIIRCKYRRCVNYFKTIEERDKHLEDVHNSGEDFPNTGKLCNFCDEYCESQKTHFNHMKYRHKEALKCKIGHCPNYFKTEEDRQKHVQEKHSKIYKCFYCNEKYQWKHLSTHINAAHKDVALRCEYSRLCATWFKTEEERQKHYKEKHARGANCVLCPFCLEKFPKLLGIQQHFKIHHPKEEVLKCDYDLFCANYFKNEQDRLKHVKEFHNSKIHCLHCDKFFSKCLYMFQHVRKDHKDVAIRCNFSEILCATYFKTAEDRDNHVKEVHQKVEKIRKPAPCIYCGRILAGRDTLSVHMKLKHAKTAIRCHFIHCPIYFKSQEDLQVHFSMYPKHQQNKKVLPTKFQCALCVKSYVKKTVLYQHIQSAHINNREKALCPHCKKTTSSKANHILSDVCKVCNQKFLCLGLFRSHTIKCKRVIQCLVCAKSFKNQNELTLHGKIYHTVPIVKWKGLQYESRGFKCDDCLIYFQYKASLKIHMQAKHTHSESTCDICKKVCVNKFKMQSHIRLMHLFSANTVLECAICQKKLRTKFQLRNHINGHIEGSIIVECKMCAKLVKKPKLWRHMLQKH